MKIITQALQETSLQLSDLPENIQSRIEAHRQAIVKFNEAVDEYDEDEAEDKETEKKLDEMEDAIASNEKDIADDIRNFKTPQESPKKDEKSSSGIGWLIFAGVALVATVGAVNLFKKK